MLCTSVHTDGAPVAKRSRLAVGFPLGHTMPSRFFSHWLHMDQSPVIGAITVTGVYLCQNMDVMVDKALSLPGWDRLVVFEHDMLPPLDALRRISDYQPEHHIVGSMYFQKTPPFHANVLMQNSDDTFNPVDAATVGKWCDDSKLYEVDGVGWGLTSVSRHVLEEWDSEVDMFNTNSVLGSHDLWFCHYARRQGFKVFADSGVVCDHLGEASFGLADNQRQLSPERKKRAPSMQAPRARVRLPVGLSSGGAGGSS